MVSDRPRDQETRIIKELPYVFTYVWLLYVVFSFNGIAIVSSSLVVICNCPYLNGFAILNNSMCPPTK